jgi:hypothetical protein
VVALLVAGCNCQQLVLAALYTGSGCGTVSQGAYLPANLCLGSYIPNTGIFISYTAGSSSGTVSTYSGVGFQACVGTPSNTSFNIGSCFSIQGLGSATIYQTSTQLWSITQTTYNSAATCSSSPNLFVAGRIPVITGGACQAQVCACSLGSCNVVSCQTSQPGVPGGYTTYTAYNDSNCQTVQGIAAVNVQGCFVTVNATAGPVTATSSASYNCNGNTLTANVYSGNTNCNGNPTSTLNYTGSCTLVNVSPGVSYYYQIGCGSSCFHKDTEIIYKDEKLTLDSLKEGKHPSCTVPHIFTSEGVKISTSCDNATLRLTTDHLVYTQRGLIEAKDVKVGDSLYQDLQETRTCKVVSAEKENSLTESYFGLNCEESVVLANGFKTSTFGKVHFLPSLWMRIMSPLIGVKAASAWGDYFSHLVQRYKLF